jgi:uncharacterized protein
VPASALYAALLALLFLFMSAYTVRLRGTLRVALGDGGQRTMTRAMRAHANFAEYVPFALLLMYIMERHTNSLAWVHTLGVLLVVARVCHAWGLACMGAHARRAARRCPRLPRLGLRARAGDVPA